MRASQPPVKADEKIEPKKNLFAFSFFGPVFLFNKINDDVYSGAGLQLNCKGQPTQADLNHRTTERGPVLFLLTGTIAAGGLNVCVGEHHLFFWVKVQPVFWLEHVLTFFFLSKRPKFEHQRLNIIKHY